MVAIRAITSSGVLYFINQEQCMAKKFCPGCGEERDTEKDFRWKYKDRGIRQRWCKYCQAEANKDHYRNDRQDYLNRALTRNARVNTENRQNYMRIYLNIPASIAVKMMCAFLSLTMYGAISLLI